MPDYTVHYRAGARTIRLSIKPDGSLHVHAPRFASQRTIAQFVASQSDWIQRVLAQKADHTPTHTGPYRLFGREYQLFFGYRPDLSIGWHIVDHQVFYNSSRYHLQPKTTVSLTPDEQHKLATFTKNTFAHYVTARLPQLHARMNLPVAYHQVRFKNQASCWGSCSSAGNLNFNYQLVHYPPEVIDYVLIHELSHLVHPDHSRAFWALVAKFDGDYQKHRRMLKH